MNDAGKRSPTYPLYVVIPQAAARLPLLPTLLEPLSVTASAARIHGVDLYYRAGSDIALLALRFDARFTSQAMVDQLTSDAARIAGGVLDPGRLPDEARRRFFAGYLPQFDVRILELPSPEQALRALGRHLEGSGELAEGSSSPVPAATPLEVRFRRGDAWQLARVRSVTDEGISLATGAPPRRGDIVDLELTAGTMTLVARASVVGVTSRDAAKVLGAAGFGARFMLASPAEKNALERLLAAIGDGVSRALTPPPRRREARYPIRWPVTLKTARGKSIVSALDVSRHGLFVGFDRAGHMAQATTIHVTLPVDDGAGPIQAIGRIARAIPEDVARARGIAAGYGLELTSFTSDDAARFAMFVARVGHRAEKTVVVGASAGRLDAICAELSAAGYTAAGAADPPTLVAKAAAPACAPDLVVIDSSLEEDNPRGVSAARRALSVRTIKVLQVDGDEPRACREWADATLLH